MAGAADTLFGSKSIALPHGGPLYLQLKRWIEDAVHRGAIKPGEALPSERDLAARLDMSRVTVRKAVQDLVREGVLVQRHGSGTYVAQQPNRVEQSLSQLTSFTEDMARRGMTVRSIWLDRGVYPPSPEETIVLGLSSTDAVARIARLRLSGDTPLAIERAALSSRLLPDPEAVGASLYAHLDKTHHRPVRAIQRIRAVSLGEDDAKLLDVAPGAASLHIERTSYLASGRVVEFTRSIYRGDTYDFVAELRLGDRETVMAANATHMRIEIEEIPAATRRLLDLSGDRLAEAGAALRQLQPVMIATIARGSSDNAASFLKYAIELTAGIPVASIGPSVMSIYGRELHLDGCAAISISQSGKSPDIVAMAESARRNGALGIALTNTAGSPLALASNIAIDLNAGVEQSVAATKSFVSSVVAGLSILAHWAEDESLLVSLKALPGVFERAVALDWTPVMNALKDRHSLYVLGRGPALAIAAEAALKFKETCGIHAEAYSAAEVLHGPARIVEAGFPVLALASRDAGEAGVAEIADRLARQGASAFATTDRVVAARQLPFAATGHPITDALSLIVSFYAFVEMLSRHRGLDPDHPPHLRKVTETL